MSKAKPDENRLESLRALSELIADCCWVRHERPDGTYRREWVAGSVERLTGYSEEEFDRLDRADFIHPDDLEHALAHIDQPKGVSNHEFRVITRGGEVRWLHETMRVVTRPDGRTAVYGATRDITAKKHAEEVLQRSLAERHQSQKLEALGKLAGGVAHDFNNLLTVIVGNAEMLKFGDRDASLRLAGEIRSAADRAAALTRQLLAFSRKQSLRPQVTDLNALVAGMSSLLRRLVREDIEIDLDLDPALGCVRVDPIQFEQVLINLVANAQDSLPTRISLASRHVENAGDRVIDGETLPVGPYAKLAVTDDGSGMDRATAERVFEPFFTTKDPGKGTGLGLAAAYGVIKQSAGHIIVSSEPGSGTTFEIYLPSVNGVADPHLPQIQAAAPPRGTETVLVVEDESMVRTMVRSVLAALGYLVFEARDASDALRISDRRSEPIDLLLTDVVMPRVSGPELADRLRRDRPDTAVLFMSGYTGEALDASGTLARGVPLLSKPFDPLSLAAAVRQVIDAKKASK